MLLVMALLAAQAQDGTKGPKGLRPLNDPGSWVTSEDYPPSAVRQGHDGTVAFKLQIDRAGIPADCAIEHSSGYDELDQQVCTLLVKRARFSPALDASGNPMTATYHNRFTWKIQRGEVFLEPFRSRMEFELSADNTLLSCSMNGKHIDGAGEYCGPMTIGGNAYNFMPAGAGKHRRITMESNFEIGGRAKLLYDTPGQMQILKRTALFEADADGKRIECKASVETPSGNAWQGPDLCSAIPPSFAGKHLAPAGKDGPLSGSATVATSWKELP